MGKNKQFIYSTYPFLLEEFGFDSVTRVQCVSLAVIALSLARLALRIRKI